MKIKALIIGLIIFTSCETVKVAKFASVESVMELKLNSTLPEVISLLGSKPYNIYSNHKDGYTIYTYKYKLIERKISPKLINSRGGETTGTEEYLGKEQTLYLFFKDGKLDSFLTSEGRKDGTPLIILNNTIQMVAAEKGKYINVSAPSDDSKSSPAPVVKKKKRFFFF
jgi:hypothetical protein